MVLTKYLLSTNPALPTVLFFVLYLGVSNKHNNQNELFNYGDLKFETSQLLALENGEFCALLDAIPRRQEVSDNQLVTFVTQLTLDHLDSLIQVSSRWRAPISAAVFLPNDSLASALRHLYLLHETSDLLASHSSLHLFWRNHDNDCQRMWQSALKDQGEHWGACTTSDCLLDKLKSMATGPPDQRYPVNVARNLARQLVATPYELVADVELIPSEGFAEHIAQFLRVHDSQMQRGADGTQDRAVYVVAVFEVDDSVAQVPRDKYELKRLLGRSKAVPFHYFKAPECHRIPSLTDWLNIDVLPDHQVGVLVSTRWQRPCWEPVFVARTGLTPKYDTRFRGYGKNKIQQLYEMCRANFTFHVLNDLFLVHRHIDKMTNTKWLRIRSAVLANNMYFEVFRRRLDARYPDMELKNYCDALSETGTPSLIDRTPTLRPIDRIPL